MACSALMASIGQQVLTKRSTHVDQNFRISQGHPKVHFSQFITSKSGYNSKNHPYINKIRKIAFSTMDNTIFGPKVATWR